MRRFFENCFKMYLLLLLCAMVAARSTQKCVEPKTLPDISFDLMINITQAHTYSILPNWYSGNKENVPSEYIEIKHEHYSGKTKCKKPRGKIGRRRSQESTINSLSQCMWRYVKNTDTNRIPKAILEAECICNTPLYSKRKSGLVCQSVVEYVVVFRRIGCTDGVYDYKLVWEPRAAACVTTSLPEPQRSYTIAYKIIE